MEVAVGMLFAMVGELVRFLNVFVLERDKSMHTHQVRARIVRQLRGCRGDLL